MASFSASALLLGDDGSAADEGLRSKPPASARTGPASAVRKRHSGSGAEELVPLLDRRDRIRQATGANRRRVARAPASEPPSRRSPSLMPRSAAPFQGLPSYQKAYLSGGITFWMLVEGE